MRNRSLILASGLIISLFFSATAVAAISGTTRVASGLTSPTFATFRPGDPNHLFVLQKGGVIKVVDLTTKSVLATPFLTIQIPIRQRRWIGRHGIRPRLQQNGCVWIRKVLRLRDRRQRRLARDSWHSSDRQFSLFHRHPPILVSANPLVASAAATEIMSWPRPRTIMSAAGSASILKTPSTTIST